MNNIEKNDKIKPNIEWKLNSLSENLNSVNEERLIDICKNIPTEELDKECKNLNNIFTQELEKKGLNFKWAIIKLEKPIGVS